MANTKIPVELSSTPSIVDNGDATAITITSDEKVGVGTANPSQLLTVESNSFPILQISNTLNNNPTDGVALDLVEKQDGFAASTATFGQTGVYGYRLKLDGSTNKLTLQSGSQTTINDRVTVERDTGNIGIGTSSPTSYANSQKTLVIEDSTSPAIAWSDTGQTRDWFAIAQGSGLYFNYGDGGGSGSASNVSSVMVLDNSGHVTKPLQSAFNVFSNSVQSSISTGYTTVQMDAEVFDVNADFDVSTYTFTAPVTGKYLLQAHVSIRELPLNAGWFLVGILTSNGAYNFSRTTTPYDADFGGTLFTLPVTVVADMDANDTAYVRAYQYSGTTQTDIYGHSSNPYTYFSGYLLG